MSNTITIRTNNVPRDIVHGFELTEKQRAEFDYMDDVDNGQFFVYKGQIYDLGEFMRIDADLIADEDNARHCARSRCESAAEAEAEYQAMQQSEDEVAP